MYHHEKRITYWSIFLGISGFLLDEPPTLDFASAQVRCVHDFLAAIVEIVELFVCVIGRTVGLCLKKVVQINAIVCTLPRTFST